MEVQNKNKGNLMRRERPKYYCLQVTLSDLLAERKLSIRQFALEANVGVSSVYEWLDGSRIELAEVAESVAKYFGIDRNQLEFGTQHQQDLQKQLDEEKAKTRKLEMELALKQMDFETLINKIEMLETQKVG